MKSIAIIPARGGSKRIPRKNIKEFYGKPMIAYSIEAAKASGCFERIIVSTDDQEIADVARQYGAEVPFLRPDNISDDHATTMDVLQHAISWCKNANWQFDNICCIYATAPFIQVEDLQKGRNYLTNKDVMYAFSATSFPFPIQRAFYLNQQSQVEMFQPEHLNTRSQDLPEAFHDAGQFYWCKVEAIEKEMPFFSTHSRPVILPRKRVQDIDTPEDWELAELLSAALRN
ncbi:MULTISPECIES: pseudaminic acid cytidylyltransferase [Pseudoalteromonas]|uniref:pseudaminic acid cytidylyltransferase n=1 Tax=Pseudoalteromonas TaxID=53246 RepID=UPI001581DC45|nr:MULTISPECIES: pseudaminic acid cytidylyltransferase [Pseudoalteromonas]MDI4652864.1 pseudaminic acid cytidylyltransferase [Pseudoalteromonas shioyasakiensis]NUJ39652.1 pseudaminic acid cytidylyltransferase [Pseudoalteromonas sp. 0303]